MASLDNQVATVEGFFMRKRPPAEAIFLRRPPIKLKVPSEEMHISRRSGGHLVGLSGKVTSELRLTWRIS